MDQFARCARTTWSLWLTTVVLVCGTVLGAVPNASAGGGDTLIVDSAADPGDGDCATNGCTLREAVAAANADSDKDRINFAIPGAGVQTITLTGELPEIIAPLTIDGYTQSDAAVNTAEVGTNAVLRIELVGSGSNTFRSMTIAASGTTVRGLAINRFLHGVNITGASDVAIRGNFLGTDPTGTTAFGNLFGVAIESNGNRVGGTALADRNLISGNVGSGVSIQASASTNLITGNVIGLAADGVTALGNGGDGIEVNSDARSNRIAGNQIAGNSGLGIDLLFDDGPSPNDPKDRDQGGNRLQNSPELTLVQVTGNGTTIKGKLNSTPNTTFTIEVFVTASGLGSDAGQILLGKKTVTTDKKGKGSFTLSRSAQLPAGDVVTATATNKNKKDTSEFSAPLVVA